MNEDDPRSERERAVLDAVDHCNPHTDGERFCLYGVMERLWDAAIDAAAKQIDSSTGPTGGWLDSPKAIFAAILALKGDRNVEQSGT